VSRVARLTPAELTPGWPDQASPNADAEIARRIAVVLAVEVDRRGWRPLAAELDVSHSQLVSVVRGVTYPTVVLVGRLERLLGRPVWPGRVLPVDVHTLGDAQD
jgi:hypothetical protein